MSEETESKEDVYARVRQYARNRAEANGRDPALAADLAEIEYARNNETSIEDAVRAAAGAFEPDRTKRRPVTRERVPTMRGVDDAFEAEFGS